MNNTTPMILNENNELIPYVAIISEGVADLAIHLLKNGKTLKLISDTGEIATVIPVFWLGHFAGANYKIPGEALQGFPIEVIDDQLPLCGWS